MIQKTIITALIFTSSMALANNGLAQKKLQAPAFAAQTEEAAPTAARCSDLAKLVQNYSSGRRQLQQQMTADIYDTANVMNSWYASLSTNYGKNVYVPYGAFDNIRTSASTTIQNGQIFTQKDTDLNSQLDQIVLLAAKCSP